MKTTWILFLCLASLAALAQDPPAEEKATAPAKPTPGGPARAAEPEIKPYDKVITKDAKSTAGIFQVHRIKDKIYFEIPKNELGKDFLLVVQLAKVAPGTGFGGTSLGNHVIRWERRDKRIFLRTVNFDITADAKTPIAQAVTNANTDTIIAAFNIEAEGKEETAVIEVTKLYATETSELTARRTLGARGFDAARSFVDRVASYPLNIEVDATHTYTAPLDAPAAPASSAPVFRFGGNMRGTSATVGMHFSMVKLPENPMMPRLKDERVGYFSLTKTDYGTSEHKAAKRTYITRWRLEKKNPSAAVSEPVKPIVYYVDPATPKAWVPFVKHGIESWQKAFEAAGYLNAIQAKEAPSKEEDPNWSPEDARYSVVRWAPSTVENAVGPHVHDPRTGEILEADILMFHNVMALAEDWYFTQVAPLDPRAKILPLPEPLMGRLIEFVVAHEVGHTLGFQHNMKASSMYPAEKVRDREWVKKMGHTPSIMDYSRFNYVAQPEDKIDVEDLVPSIGPYDVWATVWGYKEISGVDSPEGEKPTLDKWAREQDKTPWFRFSSSRSNGADPGELTEAVGDADAVSSTRLGLKNLERVAAMLIPATEKQGENYDHLEELYGRMLGQWTREMGHVAVIVGGVNSQQKAGGQSGVIYTVIAKEKQKAALDFLQNNAFQTPKFLIMPEVFRRIEADGAMAKLRSAQQSPLNMLLANSRISRMVEQEAIEGEKAYKASDFLSDLRKGLFRELNDAAVITDAFRQSLQQGYVQTAGERVNSAATEPAVRSLLRAELKSLSADLQRAQAKIAIASVKAHMEDLRDHIAKILDPKFQSAGAPTSGLLPVRRGFWDPTTDPEMCWIDLDKR